MVKEDNGLFRDFCFWLGSEARKWIGDYLRDEVLESEGKDKGQAPTVVITDELLQAGPGGLASAWTDAGLDEPKIYLVNPTGETFTAM